MPWLKFAPYIIIAVLLSIIGGMKYYYSNKIENLSNNVATERANVKILSKDLESCKSSVKEQNKSIDEWKAKSEDAQIALDKAIKDASDIRKASDKRIRDILSRPLATDCSSAIKELRDSAREDSVW